MSRTWSSDGRFYMDEHERSSDSYMYSNTSYSWRVVRSEDDVEVASFSGHWDQDARGESKSGTRNVRFSDDSRALLVTLFDGQETREPLPPLDDDERRAAKRRLQAWDTLISSTSDTQTALIEDGSREGAQLFGRSVSVYSSFDGMHIAVGEFNAKLPLDGPRRLTTCNGLELAVTRDADAHHWRIVAREVAPAQRHPDKILAEEWQAFADAHGPPIPLGAKHAAEKKRWKHKVTSFFRKKSRENEEPFDFVYGHRVERRWSPSTYVLLRIDGTEIGLRSKLDVKRHEDIRFAVELVFETHTVMLYAAKD